MASTLFDDPEIASMFIAADERTIRNAIESLRDSRDNLAFLLQNRGWSPQGFFFALDRSSLPEPYRSDRGLGFQLQLHADGYHRVCESLERMRKCHAQTDRWVDQYVTALDQYQKLLSVVAPSYKSITRMEKSNATAPISN